MNNIFAYQPVAEVWNLAQPVDRRVLFAGDPDPRFAAGSRVHTAVRFAADAAEHLMSYGFTKAT